MPRSSAAFLSLAALILAAQTAMGAPPSNLEECQAQLAQSPDGEAPALCLHELATGTGPFRKAAAQRLQKLAAKHPERPWLLIYLGRVKWQNREGADAVAELYTAAARVAARRGMAEAELIARWSLCRILRDTGRLDEEEAQVERAARIAESSGLPRLRLRADILRALHWSARGEFEQAYLTLRRIQVAAQRDRMEAGAPAVAWAGVVVLGDGGRVPVPGGRGSGPALAAAAVLLLLAAALLIRRRVTASRPGSGGAAAIR